jgi:hypothetical protein
VTATCVRERNGVWHVVRGRGDSWFRPIMCSEVEGINLPGTTEVREPTCSDCVRAMRNTRRLADVR